MEHDLHASPGIHCMPAHPTLRYLSSSVAAECRTLTALSHHASPRITNFQLNVFHRKPWPLPLQYKRWPSAETQCLIHRSLLSRCLFSLFCSHPCFISVRLISVLLRCPWRQSRPTHPLCLASRLQKKALAALQAMRKACSEREYFARAADFNAFLRRLLASAADSATRRKFL